MISLFLLSAASAPWFEPADDRLAPRVAMWRGIAWNDLDGDGDADLAVSRTGGATIFRNDRGRLTPVHEIEEQGLDGEGVALLDLDADARPDLFLANRSGPPRLYLNRGNFRFGASIDELRQVTALSHAGCFADFDGDGWLDLALITRDGADDLMFRNDRGRFRLVPDPLRGSGGDGRTCAVGDWNGDARPDLYIGNFLEVPAAVRRRATDRLYLNEAGFRFRGLIEGHVVNLPSMTYGATAVDWNEDGKLDLAITHDGRADRNALYENRAAAAGTVDLYPRGDELQLTTIQRGPSKGQVIADFDNDGDFDVFYAEGTEGLTAEHAPFDARDELHERAGDRFVRRTEAAIDADMRLGAGAAQADVDLDGDLDLLVANWGGAQGQAMQLYRNVAAGRSISIALVGTGPSRQAIGTRIALEVEQAGKRVTRHSYLWPQTGYGSMAEPVVHFGLPSGQRPLSVAITWPDGTKTSQPVTGSGRIVVRQTGTAAR